MGLHFVGYSAHLYDQIKTFVILNNQWLDAPHHETVRAAQPFIQSDNPDYLFIEFWTSNHDAILAFADLLAQEFNFEYDLNDL
jgi:hypothetical protein